jgi:tetratricopeptide (TPR) repeat protein
MASERPPIELVDRVEPLRQLKELLDSAAAGKGHIIFISGEAGIGKTRLAREMEHITQKKGATYLYGRCLSLTGSDPYLPFLDALRAYARSTGGQDRQDTIAQSAGGFEAGGMDGPMPVGLMGVSELFGQDGAEERGARDKGRMEALWRVDAGRERDRIYEAISSALLGIAAERPIVLFLDDFQWADSASLQLLMYLSHGVQDARALILCAYRFDEILDVDGKPHPLRDVLYRMQRERIFGLIPLEHLTRADTNEMLVRLLGTGELPDMFVDKIFDRTNGNPYFIEELVKDLVAKGHIETRDGGWTSRVDLDALRLPQSIRAIISEKLSRFDPKTQRTLEMAAILGLEFQLEVLQAVSDEKEEALVDQLDRLLKAKILREDSRGDQVVYRFTDNVVRSLLDEGLSTAKKRLLHRKAAAAMEKRYGQSPGEKVYALAHHFNLGGDQAKSLRYMHMAGSRAFKALALEEASGYFRTAVKATDGLERSAENLSLRMECLLSLANIHTTSGDIEGALKGLDEVISVAGETGNDRLLAIAYERKAFIALRRADLVTADALLEKALRIYTDLKDVEGQARTLCSIAMSSFRKSEHSKALEQLARAMELSKGIGDDDDYTTAVINMAGVHSELGDFDNSEKYYAQAETLARKLDDPSKLARLYNNWGDLRMRQWRYADSIPILEKGLEPVKRSGNTAIRAVIYANIGESLVHTGDSVKGMPYLEKARAIFERVGDALFTSRMVMVGGVVHRNAGEWDQARRMGLDSITMVEPLKMPLAVAEYTMEYGITLARAGDKDEARRVLERAAKIFSGVGAKEFLEKTNRELAALGN